MFKLQHPRASGALLNQSYPKIVAMGWELHEGESGKDHKHHFDLAERAAKFGEGVVRFSKRIPRDPGNDRLIGQLVGSGTSLGANYLEATEAVSKKDFKCSISRSAKEAKEAKFFLRMVAAAEPGSPRTPSDFRRNLPQKMKTSMCTCMLNLECSLNVGWWMLNVFLHLPVEPRKFKK